MDSTLVAHAEPPEVTSRVFDGHVVFLTSYIPPHTLPVYVELAKRVRKLTVLISTPMESNRKWKPEHGSLNVQVQRTLTIQRPWKHPTGFSEPLAVHIPWDTFFALRSLRPDVIISGQLGARTLLSSFYSSATRTPLIVYASLSEHQERGRGLARHLLRRWLIRRASSVAVNGTSGARYLRQMGLAEDRLFHVPYSAVQNRFDELPITRPADQAHKLLYAGQLIDRKGLVPFVETLARWARDHRDETVEFSLAGYGPLEQALRAIDRPGNLRVNFLGECSFAQLSECYATSGILAFPTLSDEWGLIVNEALAAGLPVLGSVYSQAVEELVLEGETGWRFRTDVGDEMYAAIDRALTTPVDKLNDMRRAGRELVKPLTPEFVADRFLATIEAAAK